MKFLYHLNKDETAIIQVPATTDRIKGEDFYATPREAYEALLAQVKERMGRDSIILMEVLKELA